MRIDSGLSGYYYQSRSYNADTEIEEAPANEAAAPKPRTSASLTVSSTLLSPSLSNALWALDGGKKAVAASMASATKPAAESLEMTPLEQISALYLEHSPAEDEYLNN